MFSMESACNEYNGHVLKDLAKLENTVLFEYVNLADGDGEWCTSHEHVVSRVVALLWAF